MNNTSSTPELHLQLCDLTAGHNHPAKRHDRRRQFDPMSSLPPGLVAELNALKDGDPNTEITLTIYRGRCKMEVYL